VHYSVDTFAKAIRAALTDELLDSKYKEAKLGRKRRPYEGHCAVATQAMYFLLGGKDSGYEPKQINHEGSSHWFLLAPDKTPLDLTAEQFKTPVPYHLAVGRGFSTGRQGHDTPPPPKRAKIVMERVRTALKD
jgi:hypothetical protein